MVRYFLIYLVFLSTILNGNILDEKIKNIIGEKEYKVHQNLIELLFRDKNKFIINKKIKYYPFFKELRDNGLLNLRLDRPKDITIQFNSKNQNLKAYKILKDTLYAMGYRYFLTKSFIVKESLGFSWKIGLKAEYMLDPVILLKELQQKNCKILNIEKGEEHSWLYEIDFDRSVIDEAYKIDKNEKVKFQKPLQEYFLMVDDAKTLQIISRRLNNWFPNIVFFDKSLNVLKVIKKNRIYRGYKTKVPKGTKYIKITDMYNLINIKRGLSVIVK